MCQMVQAKTNFDTEIDDGPHPYYTEQLLDGLKERGVVAAVSDSPLGKFKRCPENPVLIGNEKVSGCGHHCIVQTPAGELYLLYHTHAVAGSQIHPRQLALDKLYWKENRLETSGPSIIPQPMPAR